MEFIENFMLEKFKSSWEFVLEWFSLDFMTSKSKKSKIAFAWSLALNWFDYYKSPFFVKYLELFELKENDDTKEV